MKVSNEAFLLRGGGTRTVFQDSSKKGIISSYTFHCATNARSPEVKRTVVWLPPSLKIGPARSLVVSHLCGALGIDVYVLGKEYREVMVWGMVCRGDTQNARQNIGLDKKEQESDDAHPPHHNPPPVESGKRLHAASGMRLHAETQLKAKAKSMQHPRP